MTGYGRGAAETVGRRVVVEIRAVNHRFIDIKLRGSPLEPSVEDRVTSRLRRVCSRGMLTVNVRLAERGAVAGAKVDVDAARRVHAELSELANALGIDEPVGLALICAQPGVLVPVQDEPDVAAIWQSVEAALEPAVAQLVAMREAEGATLARDLDRRATRLDGLIQRIASEAEAAPEQAMKRLDERLARLLENSSVDLDDSRRVQEIALLADRVDVTEEIVRLRSHLEQLGRIMADATAPIGRQLEFLVQEIGREFNTVAAKSQSGDIARAVVEAKAELEKIREQVQNIE